MSIEWKMTPLLITPITTIEHWKKHDPYKLLEALEKPPIKVIDSAKPSISVHEFGKHHLAVRELHQHSARRIYRVLMAGITEKAALIEVPVALIRKEGNYKLVTLWKKNTRPFPEFLADNRISLADKEKACLSVMRKLAKTHLKGFTHGHLKPENLLAYEYGKNQIARGALVDCTVVQRRPSVKALDASYSLDNESKLSLKLAALMRTNYSVGKSPEAMRESLEKSRRFRNKLWREYWLARFGSTSHPAFIFSMALMPEDE